MFYLSGYFHAHKLPQSLVFPLRALHRLRCQQAVLDQLGQRYYQQVQSGRQQPGGAGGSEEGLSQRHCSGRDG